MLKHTHKKLYSYGTTAWILLPSGSCCWRSGGASKAARFDRFGEPSHAVCLVRAEMQWAINFLPMGHGASLSGLAPPSFGTPAPCAAISRHAQRTGPDQTLLALEDPAPRLALRGAGRRCTPAPGTPSLAGQALLVPGGLTRDGRKSSFSREFSNMEGSGQGAWQPGARQRSVGQQGFQNGVPDGVDR